VNLAILSPQLNWSLEEAGLPWAALAQHFSRLALDILLDADLAANLAEGCSLEQQEVDRVIDEAIGDGSGWYEGSEDSLHRVCPLLYEVLVSRGIPVINLLGHLNFLAADIELDDEVREQLRQEWTAQKLPKRAKAESMESVSLLVDSLVYAGFCRDYLAKALLDKLLDIKLDEKGKKLAKRA
tara:strand:- start:16 stop:564 length:549 start_codon:yes stop_codon:yes gene_type:complete